MFKSNIGNNVIIGDKVIVVNVDIPDNANISSSRKILSQEDFENLSMDNKENSNRTDEKKDNKEKGVPGFDLMILLGGFSMIYLLRKKLKL